MPLFNKKMIKKIAIHFKKLLLNFNVHSNISPIEISVYSL